MRSTEEDLEKMATHTPDSPAPSGAAAPARRALDQEVIVIAQLPVGVDADLDGLERDTLVLAAEERRWARRRVTTTAGRTLALAVCGFGIFTIGFGVSTSFWLSVAMLTLAGASDMISVSIRSNLLQTVTPTHLFGRVSAVNSVFVGSSNEIGMFESGVTAQWFGTVPSVVLGGAVTLVVVATVFGRNKALRGLRRIHELGDWSDDNATSPRRE